MCREEDGICSESVVIAVISEATEAQAFIITVGCQVDYAIPEVGNRDQYITSIEELPLASGPEVLGLHPNAEIGYYTFSVRDMWLHLVELQPRTGTVRS